MFGRENSLFRRCVPFKFNIAGPVAAVAQRTFERFPHTFAMALEHLEELDTTPEPRAKFAAAWQAMAQGTLEQHEICRMFAVAEDAARIESCGGSDFERWNYDPEYRLDCYQLHMAAGFWERMLRVHPQPWIDAEVFAHHRYSSDVRRDVVLTKYCELVMSEDGRGQINDDIDNLLESIILLERDLYGQHRFDKRGDQMFLFQSLKLGMVSRNPDTAAGVIRPNAVRALDRVGNFDVTTINIQDRWIQYSVRCKEEDDPAPWSELIEVPELRRSYNPNIPRLCPAGRRLAIRAPRRDDDEGQQSTMPRAIPSVHRDPELLEQPADSEAAIKTAAHPAAAKTLPGGSGSTSTLTWSTSTNPRELPPAPKPMEHVRGIIGRMFANASSSSSSATANKSGSRQQQMVTSEVGGDRLASSGGEAADTAAASSAPSSSSSSVPSSSSALAKHIDPNEAFRVALGSQPAGHLVSVPSEGLSPLTLEEMQDRGFVRIHFDSPIIPRRETRDNLTVWTFELAVDKPLIGMFPPKMHPIYGM